VNLSVALRLGRVSNLPTVTSNVLAAIALAGGVAPSGFAVVAICIAMSVMYVAGMFLNDAFDRDIDARERPERPIPAGEVTADTVFATGFAMLAAGIALIGAVAFTEATGSRPLVLAIVLGALIVIYDAYHKQNPLSPIVMGLCRVGVYATAAYTVTRSVDPALARGMFALLGYLIGLTYIARQENLSRVDNLWPLAVMAVPVWLAFPHGLLAWITYLAWLGQTGLALSLLTRRKIRDAVGLLIANISLLDATFAANHHEPVFAINAALAFLATRWLQRSIAGT
jgi:4-hydroxybenzoate polyprenyltransferase